MRGDLQWVELVLGGGQGLIHLTLYDSGHDIWVNPNRIFAIYPKCGDYTSAWVVLKADGYTSKIRVREAYEDLKQKLSKEDK